MGIAGLCCAICPDSNCLDWWSKTALSEALTAAGGFGFSAVCFGFATSVIFGTGAALLAPDGGRGSLPPLLPAIMMVLLLAPGLILQAFGTTWLALAGWVLGTTLGAYVGVWIGLATRARLRAP